MRLDSRLDRLEGKFQALAVRRGGDDRYRALMTWARQLHPAEFKRFEEFFGDFSGKHPGLSWRESLIELSKDATAVGIARQLTELIVAQFGERSGELQ